MSWYDVLTTLLPRAKAFRVTHQSALKNFIKGLAVLPTDVQSSTDQIYFDLFPASTRALEEWETQFAVLFADEQYGTPRRDILQSLWRANTGGQSAKYLQELLQKIHSGILVTENIPTKNPRDANAVLAAICGQRVMCCGNVAGNCGYKLGDSTFTPNVIRNDTENVYDIPVDSDFWQNYFFVCGGVVRNSKHEIIYCQKIKINKKWKSYIEFLILKIKPVQTGAIVFIEWTEEAV